MYAKNSYFKSSNNNFKKIVSLKVSNNQIKPKHIYRYLKLYFNLICI